MADAAAGAALRKAVRAALAGLGSRPLREGATALFAALGYESDRTPGFGGAGAVVKWLAEEIGDKPLTDRQREALAGWRDAEVLFQITDDEIDDRQRALLDGARFDAGRQKSFLFAAVDLADGSRTRARLADAVRAVNARLKMPVVLLFRHGESVTLGVAHRRAHKRDDDRDVLERVTLVKDIRIAAPHRAHVELLADLALPRMVAAGVGDFDGLHAEWERVLDIEALNRRFFRELFEWFRRAVASCRFPDDGAGEGSAERHVIRLITRLLFIWFMKEKGLVPEELFEDEFAETALGNHAPERTDYYRAVLQNLFFATLNTEVDKRAFSGRNPGSHRDPTKYRYRDLLSDPDRFVEELKRVPFVNGGLFDCQDDFEAVRKGGKRIDVFTDNGKRRGDLEAPARLFLDPEDGLFPLFRRYKFTVEESTPLDREVALDPELLGRVFENLLAAYNPETRETARKATGSYYTPRQVVDYMVHEALTEALCAKATPADGDAGWLRERLSYLLDHSDAMDDASELFEDAAEKRAVVAAIAGLRALDPAVGSGAFPMGVLQTLTLALRRLDPDNALWEAFQIERATARAGEAFETLGRRRRADALREISETFEKYRESDFGRKLYLIQNSVYGVDIQPIACQIVKLRFFISLVIEQQPDPGAPNLGIKPLPNLETRFVAADALIGLDEAGAQGVLGGDAVTAVQDELRGVRERHFNARTRRDKMKLRAEDRTLRKKLADALETRGYGHAAAEAVARWDPYDHNARAAWFDPEWMFGVSGGFDIAIGNPPYIQLQKDGGRAGKKYGGADYETFARSGDIYQLFYERGCGLLEPGGGTLAYITSNSWMRAEYGRPLRRWLAERHTPLRLIEMGKDVFEAVVDTSVLLVREGGSAGRVPAVDTERIGSRELPPERRHWGEARPEGEMPWSILSAAEWRVLDKMRAVGKPLGDWEVRINRGITTGCNEAFVIDDATRNALIAEDPRSAKILKPVLRGRDIKRWRARWTGRWLIATFPSLQIDINEYPSVKKHLENFGRERLEQNGKSLGNGVKARKRTNNAWFETQDATAYYKDFAEEKLLWMDLADRGRFSYDADETFAVNTVFVLVGGPVKFLSAVLNSSLATWFMDNTAVTSGMGVTRWIRAFVSNIPIPVPPPEKQSSLVRLVDDILAAKDTGGDIAPTEEKIDRLVYSLYGLDEKEIALIDKVRRS